MKRPFAATVWREGDWYVSQCLEVDIATKDIFDELRKKYEVFYIIPSGASNGGDVSIRKSWQKILGQNVLTLDDPNAVCETIALSIGLSEGKVDLADGVADLRDLGVAAKVTRSVSTALATLARTAGLAKPVKVSGLTNDPALTGGGVTRL